jgi:phosphohistidine phosphatase
MSRELWLMRHGKAERYDGSEDYDRRLKKRGKRDATRIGEWLKEQGLVPDLVISSPATRAIMTAKLVCDMLDIDRQAIQLEKRLYDEGLVRVKSVLADCPSTFSRVLLVGHNPEFEDLISYLVNATDIPDVEKLLPTAALARLVLPDDWSHLEQACAELPEITYPKFLTEDIEDPFD